MKKALLLIIDWFVQRDFQSLEIMSSNNIVSFDYIDENCSHSHNQVGQL